jgi:DNA-binding transcriptional ArsR family regulator
MPNAPSMQVVDRPEQAAGLLKPIRARILRLLGAGDSAAGVARKTGLARQKVNYHLRELERAGLVQLVEERRSGNCTERILRAVATRYVIDPAMFGDVTPEPGAAVDQFSSAYLTALASQIVGEVAGLRRKADATGKFVATLSLQSEVRFASAAARHAFSEELARQFARLVARYHDPDAPGGRTFRVAAVAWPRPARPSESRTPEAP